MRTTRDARRPSPIAVSDRIGEHPPHQRHTALAYLEEKIEGGSAGLDPFDRALFVLVADANEIVWAYRMLEQVGAVVSVTDQGDGRRYKAALDPATRLRLSLDSPAPPLIDEPLASRGADAATVAMDTVLDALPDAPARLHAVAEESEGMAALHRAKAAYDATCYDNVQCPACRGTGGGVYNDCPTCSGNGVVA